MLNPKKLEEFARHLHESVPKIIYDFTCDIDTKIRKILQNQISRMHFVTREEFDAQLHILFKIQEKINQLEMKLSKLEKRYQSQNTNDQKS